jgi:hypothetical protein
VADCSATSNADQKSFDSTQFINGAAPLDAVDSIVAGLTVDDRERAFVGAEARAKSGTEPVVTIAYEELRICSERCGFTKLLRGPVLSRVTRHGYVNNTLGIDVDDEEREN